MGVDVVHDTLSPNEEVRTYTLTEKEQWYNGSVRDSDEKVLKRSVRADSNGKGCGYFVGDFGLEDPKITAYINFRKKTELLSEKPNYGADPDSYCGNAFQCFCIGCDEDALNAEWASIEAEAEALMVGKGFLAAPKPPPRQTSKKPPAKPINTVIKSAAPVAASTEK
jgi:hypothetical protein